MPELGVETRPQPKCGSAPETWCDCERCTDWRESNRLLAISCRMAFYEGLCSVPLEWESRRVANILPEPDIDDFRSLWALRHADLWKEVRNRMGVEMRRRHAEEKR